MHPRDHIRVVRDIILDPSALIRRDFVCPICRYKGFFTTEHGANTPRRFARCPHCGSVERHRLAYLALQEVAAERDFKTLEALHFAPEPVFRKLFQGWFRTYRTADLNRRNVDYQVDMRHMAFADRSFDFVFASHVLEHIDDDHRAIREVARILRPSGIAVLPVPIVSERTVEYPCAVATEHGHVRATGLDYYDRLRRYFREVRVRTSLDFAEHFQTWTWDDWTRYPTRECPYRTSMPGKRHLDAVPICIA